jgi:low affinity Fe/Cu permease
MMNKFFDRLASKVANKVGSWQASLMSVIVVLGWLLTGPLMNWSDSWQLMANTGTTIVTFLMVFLIQNEQNRNDESLHRKIDELTKKLEDK